MRLPYEWLAEFVAWEKGPEALGELLSSSGLEVESYEPKGQVFDIAVTPNRPDCLSVIGVAREIAALTATALRLPRVDPPSGAGKCSDTVRVHVTVPTRCPRYTARVIKGVRIGPSPAWLVDRLVKAGLRSINNVVDATNCVMLERGQPLHAFDARRIRGSKIIVELAGAALTFKTLDGGERTLVADDLVIADGGGPVAIAGVMGGENSEVSASTTDLVLESAFFAPISVRRTAKRLGLSTESSYRFERGVDPNGTLTALHRLTALIVEIAGGRPAADWIDCSPKKISPRHISLTAAEVNRVLGTTFSRAAIVQLMKRLGIAGHPRGRETVVFSVPTFRPDLERGIDLVEEVARLSGYDRIPAALPRFTVTARARPFLSELEARTRSVLTSSGFSEAVLMSFAAEQRQQWFTAIGNPVLLANPLSQDHAALPATLLVGLLDAVKLNRSHQQTDLRLFAIQKVYRQVDRGCEEGTRIAGVMVGRRSPGSWERSREVVDFFDARGVVETLLDALGVDDQARFESADQYPFLHAGVSAGIRVVDRCIGFVGQLHPDVVSDWDQSDEVYAFELDLETLVRVVEKKSVRFAELARFPFVARDLSIIVDDSLPVADIQAAIRGSGIPILTAVTLFDLYQGKGIDAGKKSIAVNLRFASRARTLTDGEVDEAHAMILRRLREQFGAVLRT